MPLRKRILFIILALMTVTIPSTVRGNDRIPITFQSKALDGLPPWNVDNELLIASPAQAFSLAQTALSWGEMAVGDASGITERRGLAPETVAAKWVIPGLLVCVRWETCAEGTGRFIEEGHLMLLASGAEWVDVFRHQFEALVRSDDGECETTKLTVSKQGNQIFVQKTHDEQRACENAPRVWSRIERQTWRDSSRRLATVRTVEERLYRIASGRLEYVSGRAIFDTGNRAFRPGDLAEAFRVDVSTLERRNRRLSRKRQWRGIVVIDDSLPDCRSSVTDEQ